MNKILIGTVVLASLVCGHVYAAVYNFTGQNFTTVNGSYTTAMRITGIITTSVPIPPNSALLDISGILTSWSFNDGVQTINNVNGAFSPFNLPLFTTDGGGNITAVSLAVFATPLGTAVGQTDDIIIFFSGSSSIRGLVGGVCFSVSGGFCNGWSAADQATAGGGTWAILTAAPTPVPTMSQWSLILLTMLLGLAGLAYYRRRKVVVS